MSNIPKRGNISVIDSQFSQSAKTFFFASFFALISSQILSLIFNKVLSNILSPSNFGLFSLFWVTILFISSLVQLETGSGLFRFTIELHSKNKPIGNILFTNIAHIFFMSFLFFITIWPFAFFECICFSTQDTRINDTQPMYFLWRYQ